MLHYALPYFWEYFMPVESPEMFITVYWVLFLMLLQRQFSNLTTTASISSLPFKVF